MRSKETNPRERIILFECIYVSVEILLFFSPFSQFQNEFSLAGDTRSPQFVSLPGRLEYIFLHYVPSGSAAFCIIHGNVSRFTSSRRKQTDGVVFHARNVNSLHLIQKNFGSGLSYNYYQFRK